MKIGLSLALLATMIASAQSYTLYELPAPAGISGIPYVNCVANKDALGEYIAVGNFLGSHQHAVKWSFTAASSPTVTNLAPPTGYSDMVPYGVNSSGTIVGMVFGGFSSATNAFYYPAGGSPTILSPFTDPLNPTYTDYPLVARSVNENDQVVGDLSSYQPGGSGGVRSYAFAYKAGTILPIYPAVGTQAVSVFHNAVDSSGADYICGSAPYISSYPHEYPCAFNILGSMSPSYLTATTFGDIQPGETISVAYGSSTGKIIVGATTPYSGGVTEAFRRTPGGTVTTFTSGGGEARSINAYAAIAGWVNVSGVHHAFRTSAGTTTLIDLNSKLDPADSAVWVLQEAYSINDDNWIVGVGTKSGVRTLFAFHP